MATMSHIALSLQAIYQGLSPASLPHASAPGYAEAIAQIFFVISMTSTYWSTLETMKAYVILILVPFFRRMISIHQLPDDQRCIWQIDACDVGLQKVAKAAIRQKSLADIINETTEALKAGTNPATFINNKSIVTLRNRSVSWINEAIKVIREPKLIKKAFSLCAVPETGFNLSYESLTSHEARQAIRELKNSNPKFHAEITAGRPITPSEEDVEAEESENDPTHTDELTLAQHVQIVMESDNATELAASMDQVDRSVDESDDESILVVTNPHHLILWDQPPNPIWHQPDASYHSEQQRQRHLIA
ncbi:hypothetical protein FRC11_001575 [Ceratobasidium sp. 423]|nr:hypothetical protein FRC11_001575 [Ceratobasidium sp. 423]